jgi:stage IV sporulation protein B
LDREKKKWLGLFLVLLVGVVVISPPFQALASFPQDIRVFKGNEITFSKSFPASVTLQDNHHVLQLNNRNQTSSVLKMNTNQTGTAKLQLKLFGAIPVATANVRVLPEIKVIPGGQSVGVRLKSAGLMVVGHHLIAAGSQERISPAENAGIRLGDVILKVNGHPVSASEDLVEYVKKFDGAPVDLEILRGKERKTVQVKPVLDKTEGEYRIGLYIRDSAAGVGTLTFFDPKTKRYGALGHMITDMDTQQPIIVKDGQILESSINSIEKGESGKPGEKLAQFINEKHILGTIEKNTPFGIFGKMKDFFVDERSIGRKPVPIALADEVKEGPAKILTVVEGQRVEEFNIEIVKVVPQQYPSVKGMVIKVTDPDLLKRTGGIIQGMSGSPILQNGKLVGAVTHVFVNDPTMGYGTFVEWMLQDAEILNDSEKTSGHILSPDVFLFFLAGNI